MAVVRAVLRALLRPQRDPSKPPAHRIALPRNVLASLTATTVEAAGIPLLVEVCGVHYMVAVMSCNLLATTISFFLNKYWVFEARRGRTPLQYAKQIGVAAGSFAWNSSLIWLFTEHLGLHYYLSFLSSNVIVFFCWNYPGGRWFVFSDGHAPRGAGEGPSPDEPRA